MKPILKFSLHILVFFIGISNLSAQVSSAENYINRADSLGLKYAVEKVYLHLDKPYYSSGHNIWFRAYVTDGANRPSMLSKILYVDLINPSNKIVNAMRLPLGAGLASGDIVLPDTLKEGTYRLRAYTRWMRNFGEESFFEREIKINNSFSDDVVADIAYLNATQDGQQKVEALITFTTLDAAIIPDKEVEYEISFGTKKLAQGKGITDAEGKLNLDFLNKDRSGQAGLISTTFNHNDRIINKTFFLNATSGDIDLKFFPEGGQLVDSIPSKVAFKALGPEGIGVDISGYVEDSRKARVAEFKSEHAGMGTFMLTPFSGQKYTAVITYNKEERRIELPESTGKGYVMSLRGEDSNNLLFRIIGSRDMGLNQEVKIASRSSSGTHGVTGFKMSKQFMDIAIPKQDLPTGIVQLTLFSHENLPFAERLAFIQHDDQLELDLIANKQKYNSREKVKVKLAVKNIDEEPITGSFSVAVTDIDRMLVKFYEHSILSEFLVRSELRGYVENPDYYFTEKSKEKQVQLDNLLLTQGWRRFGWKENPPELKFEAEKSISISGQVMVRNAPVEGGKVTLFSPDVIMSLDTLTDNRGRFNFDNLVFTDSTKFVVQARTEKEKSNVQIRLDNIPSQTVNKQVVTKGLNRMTLMEQLALVKNSREELHGLLNQGLLKRTNMLEEVVVKAKTYSRTMKNSSKLGNAEPDFVLTQDKVKDWSNLGHALMNKVPGMVVEINPFLGSASATLFRNSQMLAGSPSMAVYLDGWYMGTDLNVIEPNAVAYIEVIKTAAKTAIYGNQGTGGVIIITTKVFAGIADEPILESPRGIITYKPKGYTVTREFYSPDYSVKETKKNIKDLRSTIYWNPELFTGKDKNPEFEFFTADRPGTYRAVVEGLDYKGRLGRKVVTFIVE